MWNSTKAGQWKVTLSLHNLLALFILTRNKRSVRDWPTLTSVCAPRVIAFRVALDAEAKLVVDLLTIALSP